jgi:hypothetical protein
MAFLFKQSGPEIPGQFLISSFLSAQHLYFVPDMNQVQTF